MNKLAKITIIVLAVSTTVVRADDKTTALLDINKVLPKTITVVENPIRPRVKKVLPPEYTPQQKAQIVGLKLSVN